MANKQNRYAPEFRRQMVDLVRTGRSPAELSREFGPSAWTIALWVKQAARDAGKGDGGLITAEREILSKAAAWFANEKPAISKRCSDS
jgi:transposase